MPDDRSELLDIALRAIATRLHTGRSWEPALDGVTPSLREPGASFVTLERDGQLLGCIGNLEATRPLAHDVARSASLAAFEDPRLPPVTADDLRHLSLKVSVLSPLEPMPATDLDEVLGWLRPGVDGLVLGVGSRRATFLPSVWSTLPEPGEFVRHLLTKAGLPPGRWPEGARAWLYTTVEVTDPGPREVPVPADA